jgi:catechol 2,3-dioxygenase-like lactoylglutathione lyase family enzyme
MGDGDVPVAGLRVARPVGDLAVALRFYVDVVGLTHLGGFAGHDGYDGAFVGVRGADWHLELTHHASGLPSPAHTEEDLLVLYLANDQLLERAARFEELGFHSVVHPNPYWSDAGAVVFRDPDGYLLVLCPAA